MPSEVAWTTRPLGDLARIVSGATPKTGVEKNWGGAIPWCTPSDITSTPGKYLVRTERHLTPEGLASCSASLLPAGTLLLCSRATIGDVRLAATPVCTNQGVKALICNDDVCNEFIYYYLLDQKARLVERASGSTFLEVSTRDVALLPVRLPVDVAEQRTIAEALGEIDHLLDGLNGQIDKARAIKLATMQQLLTGRVRLPGFSERERERERERVEDTATRRSRELPPR